MIVISIGIGTLFGIWLTGAFLYTVVMAFAAVGVGVVKLLQAVVGVVRPPRRVSGAAAAARSASEDQFAEMVESLKRMGCPPERAPQMAREMLTRVPI